jgi:hypothetical protein
MIDMIKAMQSEAHGWANLDDLKICLRRVLPTKRNYRFSIHIDQSGSMAGEPTKYAMQATTMLMDTLEFLTIDYNIIGFSDVPSEYKRFGEGPLGDDEARNKILRLIEIGAGNGGTNDVASVDLGIERFDNEYADRKVMIIITDAQGETEKMKERIAQAREKGIEVIAIGIGALMGEYVTKVYGARGVVVDHARYLPEEISRILEQELSGDSTIDAPSAHLMAPFVVQASMSASTSSEKVTVPFNGTLLQVKVGYTEVAGANGVSYAFSIMPAEHQFDDAAKSVASEVLKDIEDGKDSSIVQCLLVNATGVIANEITNGGKLSRVLPFKGSWKAETDNGQCRIVSQNSKEKRSIFQPKTLEKMKSNTEVDSVNQMQCAA